MHSGTLEVGDMGGMQPHQLAEAIQAFAEGNREYVQQSFVGDGVVDKDVRDSRHLLLTHLTRNRTLTECLNSSM